MVFDIRMTSEVPTELAPGEIAKYGLITLGKKKYRFHAVLNIWSVAEYERHWMEAIKRILEGSKKSALIVCLNDPLKAAYIVEWYKMYNFDNEVIFQNQLLFPHCIEGVFDYKKPFDYIQDRYTLSEDGQKIAEWRLPIESLERFKKG